MAGITIRPVTQEDLPGLLAMILELAEFENLTHLMTATETEYQEALFSDVPSAGAIVAESGQELIGYAVFFENFSTFSGVKGLYLEDLYVRPTHRNIGAGKALIQYVGRVARERNCGRFEWSVLDWNTHAIDFYKRLGADVMDEWRIVRLDRSGIASLTDC